MKNALEAIEIFITTPCFNSSETIDRTINSIISQSGNFRIHYHIQDGASSDATIEKIKKWEELLLSNKIPIYCKGIKLTYQSKKDQGMYDAIARGYEHHNGNENDWTGWINADDIILPGTFALLNEIDKQLPNKNINWITGASSVDWDDVPVAWGDRPVNKEIIAAGLCDGHHWTFIQQEGTFFRKKLWNQINKKEQFVNYKYAGDWNLWRAIAKNNNEIYQTPWPTGNFSRREGQLSQSKKAEYNNEINATIHDELKKRRLLDIAKRSGPRLMIESRYSDKSLHVMQYTLNEQLKKQRDKIIKELIASPPTKSGTGPIHNKYITGYDAEWQYPAITEKHAYTHLINSNPTLPSNCLYFAFPWATLIDLIQTNSDAAWRLKAMLEYFKGQIKSYKFIITTCQHILYKKYLSIFEDVGITHILSSHATIHDLQYNYSRNVKIHPFPLYPTQVVENPKPIQDRQYLYSFIGATSGNGYLSEARKWIGKHLTSKEDAFIKLNDSWHYEKIVYQEQIKGKKLEGNEIAKISEAETNYKTAMSESVFSICPSGTGPNTIRLWEAIESEVIPVVIADQYIPPCPLDLWKNAVILINETEKDVSNIDSQLRKIFTNKAKIDSLLKNVRMIKKDYGKQSFSKPIVQLYENLDNTPETDSTSKKNGNIHDLIAIWKKQVDSKKDCRDLSKYILNRLAYLKNSNHPDWASIRCLINERPLRELIGNEMRI